MTRTMRALGQFRVSALGMGVMPMSEERGGQLPDRERVVATIGAALEAGITLFDTADIYAPSWDQVGHNERLLADAFKELGGRPEGVVIATKGGITRSKEGWGRDASPEHLRRAVQASLTALGVDVIDVYYWHRPDRYLAYPEVIETFADLKREGLIKEIGISNANVEEIEVAIDVLGDGELAAVQNEFSPKFHHTSKPELDFCARHGIAFVPWSPLGGIGAGAKTLGERHLVISQVAEAHGVSPQQVTLAWEMSLGGHVIPIPGASRPETIRDSAAAMDLQLSEQEIADISTSILG